MIQTRLSQLLLYILFLLVLSASCQAPAPKEEPIAEEEPIAYIGHGGFFDSDGTQIEMTLEFVDKAQDWYRTKLLSSLSDDKKAEFAKIEEELKASINADGQARLVVRQYLLDWLVANSEDISSDGRTIGKLNALKYELHWKLPDRAGIENFNYGEEFNLDPKIENELKLRGFTLGENKVRSSEYALASFQLPSVTVNSGQAYIDECIAAGVPIPPPIGQLDSTGLTGWKSQGFIPKLQQFITGTPAEVRTFQSSSPAGMCIALPRYTDDSVTTVKLDGVICLGQTTSKVCFWDNQMSGNGFNFPSGTVIPIGVPSTPGGRYQAGGAELENGTGGVCTDCHAGQNPYIIHPNVNLTTSPLGGATLISMGALRASLPTFSATRYDPLVPASWPQNRLSQSPALVPAACSGCHVNGGTGGAFPHLSSELNGNSGYCNTILAQAIKKTMPQGAPLMCTPNLSPGDSGFVMCPSALSTLYSWCGVPVSSGPSNRGDPHLTTTNSINYDFQAAGEFTALRNSDTFFELQTRQTPVPTVGIIPANPYTGLSSCVSLNTAVAVRVDNYRITYQPSFDKPKNAEGLELRIDGELVSLSEEGINLGNGNVIRRADSNGGLDIVSWDGTHVIVTSNYWASQSYWYLNIDVINTPAREGTMGYIPAGDWLPLAPDGSSFGPAPATLDDKHILLNEKFADAWRVTASTSLFDYAVGTSTDDFTDRKWPPKPGDPCTGGGTTSPVEPMEPQLATDLCSAIKDQDETAFANCVFDLTVTGEKGMVDAYLRSLQLREKAKP
jgi:hypothetical protein